MADEIVNNPPPVGGEAPEPKAVETPPAPAPGEDREFRRLRKENQSLRSRYNEVKAQLEATATEIEGMKKRMTDTAQETFTAQIAELQKQLEAAKAEREQAVNAARVASVRATVTNEAAAAGITGKQLEAALKLLDISQVETDEQGAPKNAAELINKLIEDYPFLKANAPDAGRPNAPKIAATNPAQVPSSGLARHPYFRTGTSPFGSGGIKTPGEN